MPHFLAGVLHMCLHISDLQGEVGLSDPLGLSCNGIRIIWGTGWCEVGWLLAKMVVVKCTQCDFEMTTWKCST